MHGEDMNRHVCCALILISVVLFSFPTQAMIRDDGELTPRMVLFCVDSLTIQDILGEEVPKLTKVFSQGACAVLNTNVAGGSNLDSAYLTLGTGVRAKVLGVQPGYMATEHMPKEEGLVIEAQARRTGASEGAVFQPGLAALIKANYNLGYAVEIGLLGTALQQAGYNIAIIGSADTEVEERPLINAFMDSQGIVPNGFVGKSLFNRDDKGPYGFWTSNETLLSEVRKVKNSADVIAIQWADLYRADKYSSFCQPLQGIQMRREALQRLDKLIGELLLEFNSHEWLFAIVTPFPSKSDPSQPLRLAPMALWGAGIPKGLLTSLTTRRAGLIANIDIAPSILEYNKIPIPAVIMGQAITIVPEENNLSIVELVEQRAVINYLQRPLVIRLFIVFLIITLALAVLAALLNAPFLARIVHRLLLAGAIIPLLLLILPLLPSLPLTDTIIIIALVAAIPAVITTNSISSQRILWSIAMVTVIALAYDIISGQNLVSSSLLGYCFISGARYYGLGNEYMGVFIGAVFIVIAGLLQHFRFSLRTARLLMLTVAISGSYFMGASWLGANAGGTLAFIGGTSATYLLLDDKLNIKKVAAGLIGGSLLLLLLVTIDWLFTNNSSHIGRALDAATNMGPQVLLGIIKRKAAMNLKLLRYSLWSRVLLMFIISLCAVFLGPFRNSLKFQHKWPLFTACLQGALVAVIVALIANDSGVVAAATLLLFPTASLILIALPFSDKNSVKISNN
jgi:hypothetical protein